MPEPTTLPLPSTPVSSAAHLYVLSADGAKRATWAQILQGDPPEEGFVWVDVTDPTPQDLLPLKEKYGLHPLAIEDALRAHQRAKVEGYSNFEFVVAHGVTALPSGELQVHEFNLFIGERFFISVRHGSGLPVTEILERWDRVPEAWRPDASSLLYVLLDALVDGYAPFVDDLEMDLRTLRQRLVEPSASGQEELRRIFELTEVVHAAYAVASPLADVLHTLLRAGPPVVSPQEVPYFRDVRDHAQRMVERLNLARLMADRAFDMYHAMENQRQGASSRQLTMVATIFMPLTLITGFFGQNFGFLVNNVIASETAFWVLCVGLETLVALVTVVLVRRIGKRNAAGPRRSSGKRAS
ncbi:magnesium transporter CorA family protein [Deinococcus aquaticus]|uniref:magnesium transporter CorA family protein n=1 Tax=Deinococcus aquaticus TaxID=328692 RepID=UPI003F46F583